MGEKKKAKKLQRENKLKRFSKGYIPYIVEFHFPGGKVLRIRP